MALTLSTIKSAPGAKKKSIDVGRGGKRGTFSGRGQKGQRARSGGTGGLKRLGLRRLMEQTPKLRGFKSMHIKPTVVTLDTLIKHFPQGGAISPEILHDKKVIKSMRKGVKILAGREDFKIKITLVNCAVSAGAKEKIEKAGGQVTN